MARREGSEDEVEVSRGSDESGRSDSSSSSKGGQDSEGSSNSSGGSGSGESGSGTSSSAAAESGDEGEAQSDRVGDVEEEVETDLFTSDNEDYRKTNASSSLPIPSLPVVNRPQHNRSNPGRGRGQSGHYNDRGPPLLPRPGTYQQRNHYGSGPGNRRPERLVAELRLSMSEETLSRKCPAFQAPSEIANFSRAPDGTVYFDSRCLRRFRRKILEESGFDLNEGYETFVEKREDLECHAFGDLLACIRNKSIPLDNIHFVTFRNNLNKILETAYNRKQPWEMGVHKRNGTVYLDVHKIPERPKTELDRRRTYWGYSFEKFATAEIDEPANENSSVVDANVEYCAVVRTKLGAHRIIMGAEIDCYDVNRDNKNYYVELKTSREVDDRFIETFEREKLLKFWIQSFIAGVPRVVIGFRGDDGRLTRTFAINTRDITQKVKAKNYWQGGVCLAFADEVLCWLYGTVKEDENYTLQFVPQSHRLELLQADTCPDVITSHLDLLRDDQKQAYNFEIK